MILLVILAIGAGFLYFSAQSQTREAKEAQKSAEEKLKALQNEIQALKEELPSSGEVEATRESAEEEAVSGGENSEEGVHTPPRGSAENGNRGLASRPLS